MDTLLIDVRPVLEQPGASFDVEDLFDLGVLHVGDNEFLLSKPAAFHVTITNAGAGIVVHGSVVADVTATCARCLCAFEDRIEGEVIGFYLQAGEPHPGDTDADEVDEVDAEGSIDIAPALMAALVVEAPFAPVHDEACKGLCPTCGQDLNAGPCDCDVVPGTDHPFASLKVLTPDKPIEP